MGEKEQFLELQLLIHGINSEIVQFFHEFDYSCRIMALLKNIFKKSV